MVVGSEPSLDPRDNVSSYAIYRYPWVAGNVREGGSVKLRYFQPALGDRDIGDGRKDGVLGGQRPERAVSVTGWRV